MRRAEEHSRRLSDNEPLAACRRHKWRGAEPSHKTRAPVRSGAVLCVARRVAVTAATCGLYCTVLYCMCTRTLRRIFVVNTNGGTQLRLRVNRECAEEVSSDSERFKSD